MAPSGIEHATFQFTEQGLNNCATTCPLFYISHIWQQQLQDVNFIFNYLQMHKKKTVYRSDKCACTYKSWMYEHMKNGICVYTWMICLCGHNKKWICMCICTLSHQWITRAYKLYIKNCQLWSHPLPLICAHTMITSHLQLGQPALEIMKGYINYIDNWRVSN
jgi:hypothetical protein